MVDLSRFHGDSTPVSLPKTQMMVPYFVGRALNLTWNPWGIHGALSSEIFFDFFFVKTGPP